MSYTVEIRTFIGIDEKGWMPHSFLTITDENGTEKSFGFAPSTQDGESMYSGQVYNDLDHKFNAVS